MGFLQAQTDSLLSLMAFGAFYLQTFYLPLVLALPLLAAISYRLYLHPLAHVPGPWLACISPFLLYAICYLGVEGRVLLYYHNKFRTPVLRIAPDAVSISEGDALNQIYISGGGLPKDERYRNFRIEGHDTIFSALDLEYRDRRAKAVLPLFAPSRIQKAYENDDVLEPLVRKFIARLQEEKSKSCAKVDILDLASRLSIDILTAYLFNKVYGGLDELTKIKNQPVDKNPSSPRGKYATKLSATPFVLAIVAFSRFSLLPNWLFSFIFSSLVGHVLADEEVSASVRTVTGFLENVTNGETSNRDTYQGRLEQAGVSPAEILVQCKGVVFAGADSTAVMLATILFHLVQQPSVRSRLREDIAAAGPGADPQAIPYLRAVVREGLRLGMANPARLTRVVPSSAGAGLTVSGFDLPAGTKVGAAAYVYHHNADVYAEPFEFRPERWLSEGRDEKVRRSREQDIFPYGLGSRACIGRNLANHQLHTVVKEVITSEVLEGARTVKPNIELVEWFNAEIKGHELEIAW